MNRFEEFMQITGTLIDCFGVLIIIVGILLSLKTYIKEWMSPATKDDGYKHFRQNIGRSILLGLEFLVAGDIIRTVVVAPTLDNVIVLAAIVLIRTFLSTSIQLELEGKWPWSQKTGPS